jgi:spore maturation protein CgeB
MVGRILRPFAERELARELVSDAQHLAPEFLLVFKGRFIRPGTIRTLRRLGVRCYNFFPDVSFRVHGPHLSRTLREYDWIFTTKTFGLKDMRDQLGISNASLLMHAFDPDVHHPVSLSERDHQLFDCDVSFIGTWSPKKEALLGELLSRRPNLRMRIWGDQWWSVTTRAHTLRSAIAGRAATGVEYAKAICGSLINIAILSEKRAGASCGDQITSRTFHLPACGGFVLHERTDEVRALFREDDEIVCFTGVDELIAKVDEFLPDERRRRLIAERGRAVVQEHHSWDERIRVILAHHERTRV